MLQWAGGRRELLIPLQHVLPSLCQAFRRYHLLYLRSEGLGRTGKQFVCDAFKQSAADSMAGQSIVAGKTKLSIFQWPPEQNVIFPAFDTVEVHVKISFGHTAFKPAAPFRNEIWSNDTILRF